MQVMLDDLIALLNQTRETTGNVPVVASGFLGTNNGHVGLQFESLPSSDSLNGRNELSLFFSLPPESRKKIVEGIEKMTKLGYTFYPSQFVEAGNTPKAGVSPCDWHNPW